MICNKVVSRSAPASCLSPVLADSVLACIGIDNYLMQLDDKTVADSNYISKMRYIVATSLFHKGLLRDKQLRRMKFDKEPPPELLIEDKK
jgi:hypothetical protein